MEETNSKQILLSVIFICCHHQSCPNRVHLYLYTLVSLCTCVSMTHAPARTRSSGCALGPHSQLSIIATDVPSLSQLIISSLSIWLFSLTLKEIVILHILRKQMFSCPVPSSCSHTVLNFLLSPSFFSSFSVEFRHLTFPGVNALHQWGLFSGLMTASVHFCRKLAKLTFYLEDFL